VYAERLHLWQALLCACLGAQELYIFILLSSRYHGAISLRAGQGTSMSWSAAYKLTLKGLGIMIHNLEMGSGIMIHDLEVGSGIMIMSCSLLSQIDGLRNHGGLQELCKSEQRARQWSP